MKSVTDKVYNRLIYKINNQQSKQVEFIISHIIKQRIKNKVTNSFSSVALIVYNVELHLNEGKK